MPTPREPFEMPSDLARAEAMIRSLVVLVPEQAVKAVLETFKLIRADQRERDAKRVLSILMDKCTLYHSRRKLKNRHCNNYGCQDIEYIAESVRKGS